MSKTSPTKTIFTLPSDSDTARQVVYGLMFAGAFFAPSVVLVYQKFVEPSTGVSTKEFFVAFSATYILLFIFISASGVRASSALRMKMGKALPRDVVVVAPAAANSKVAEIVELGRKYWFWQLVNSYFSGIAFSWLACILVLFIL